MSDVAVCLLPVGRIRPEEGLGRRRDKAGHRELQASIAQFGVLTPITVRPAQDGSGDYLLIKGQGRTLACRLLGIDSIPAVVVAADYADETKVQQFLVENVARLKMRPMDRALLIAKARRNGVETIDVARRFGVSPTTVRRLESQLEGANLREVAAIGRGNVSLTLHGVVARFFSADERPDAIEVLSEHPLKARELETLLRALGWSRLSSLGPEHRAQRLMLLAWACATLNRLRPTPLKERLRLLAQEFPVEFHGADRVKEMAK